MAIFWLMLAFLFACEETRDVRMSESRKLIRIGRNCPVTVQQTEYG